MPYAFAGISTSEAGAYRRRPAGGFAFDTTATPSPAREGWNPENAIDIVDRSGRRRRMWHEVEAVAADLLTFAETTATLRNLITRAAYELPDARANRKPRQLLRALDGG